MRIISFLLLPSYQTHIARSAKKKQPDMWMPFWICLQEKAHAWRDLSEKRALSTRRLFFVDGGSINQTRLAWLSSAAPLNSPIVAGRFPRRPPPSHHLYLGSCGGRGAQPSPWLLRGHSEGGWRPLCSLSRPGMSPRRLLG